MENNAYILQFYLLNEIWLYNITNQIYLITLLMVFSLVAYLFIKNRNGESFALSSTEQHHFLNAITRNSETSDLIIDNSGIVRFANERFLELFGLTEEIDNQPFIEINLPDGLANFIKSNDVNGRETPFTISGSAYKVRLAPVTTHDGQLLGKLIKIRSSSESIGENSDAGKWMHELNTPLNAIMGYSELLTDEQNLSESQKEYLQVIYEHSQILKERIDTLLSNSGKNILLGAAANGRKTIKKILIVDDVTINRTLLKIILKRYGYEIAEAKNGKEALDSVDSQSCDLILMDLSMPVMDGVEATEKIRHLNSQKAEVPIIAVTASSRYKSADTLKSKGFNALLKKPFKESALIELLKEFEAD